MQDSFSLRGYQHDKVVCKEIFSVYFWYFSFYQWTQTSMQMGKTWINMLPSTWMEGKPKGLTRNCAVNRTRGHKGTPELSQTEHSPFSPNLSGGRCRPLHTEPPGESSEQAGAPLPLHPTAVELHRNYVKCGTSSSTPHLEIPDGFSTLGSSWSS